MSEEDRPAPPAPAPPALHTAPDPTTAFQALLLETTPRVWVAWVMFALSVGLYGLMVASGVAPFAPDAPSLLAWGADYGPKTLGGQPWRLLTNTFLHYGLVHLGLNMLVLARVGPLVERLFGQPRFFAVYLAAGLCGSVASIAIHPQQIAVGASGAIFGLYGALAAFLFFQRGVVPPQTRKQLTSMAAAFIGYNLFLGFTIAMVDNAAHIGGLLGGAAAGWFLARPLAPGRAAQADRGRPLITVAAAVALALIAVKALPRHADFLRALDDFSAMEKRTLGDYNKLVERGQKSAISDEAYAQEIESHILPSWRDGKALLMGPGTWPGPQERLRRLLIGYAAAREQGFTQFVIALRAHDGAGVAAAQTHHQEAERLLAEIKSWKPE